MGTTVIPTRTLLSAAVHHHTTHSSTAIVRGLVSFAPNRSASRLPPRITPSPENRHSSFQHLLRTHLNTFNQRLSMLESNTLDMKQSIHSMEDHQNHLSSQLKELIAIQSVGEKDKKVGELERSHMDMEARLSRLEGRLEILIDGFTALAQEMNKMKRARHVSRSPPERRALPSLPTVLALPSYSTPPIRVTPTKTPFASKATVPRSIPTPGLPADKPTTAKLKPVKNTVTSRSQVSTRSTIKRTSLSQHRTASKPTSKPTAKPETKRPAGRRTPVTPKRVSQTKPTQAKEAITKFQLDPPSHKPTSDRANKKVSSHVKNNERNKLFRSDAPVSKNVHERGKASGGKSKNSSKSHAGNEKTDSYKLVSPNTKKNPEKNTTTKPTKRTTAKKSTTTIKKTSPLKTKATTPNKSVKKKLTPPKTKATTAKKETKKNTQKKRKKSHKSGVLDLLRLLQGDHKSAKSQDGSLHVVLGRLAIPIRIIPDD